MAKLEYKLLLTGEIHIQSGLHIGGSEVDLDIGGLDNEVIKIKQGRNRIPYIPGSSLKGKLRSLLGRKFGYLDIKDDKGIMLKLFSGDSDAKVKQSFNHQGRKIKKVIAGRRPTRLITRDSYFIGEFNQDALEEKTENVITRSTGVANPRHMERVVKGHKFNLDMILDIYLEDEVQDFLQILDLGFQLLQYDYLGGSGTRGYGKIKFENVNVKKLIFRLDGQIEIDDKFSYSFLVNSELDHAKEGLPL